jgi:hypothetical protein
MPTNSNNELVRQVRESRRRKIQQASERAAEKVVELGKKKSKPSVKAVAEVIAAEFEQLTG